MGTISFGTAVDDGVFRQRMHEDIPFRDSLFPVRVIFDMTAGPSDVPAPQTVLPISWHEEIELLLICEGELLCECDFRQFTAGAGDLVVVNPCEAHSFSARTFCRYHCVMIDLRLCGNRGDVGVQRYVEPLISGQAAFRNHIAGNPAASSIASDMIEELRGADVGYEMAVKGDLLRLLALLFREARNTGESALSEPKRRSSIAPALRCIANHYTEEITLAELSDACFMNRSYFCRKFREITGRTAISYLNEYRLAKARILLLNSPQSVSSVATAVGYSDNGYFTRKFREVYGITPSEMRRRAAGSGTNAPDPRSEEGS